jgi:hypothetical protein
MDNAGCQLESAPVWTTESPNNNDCLLERQPASWRGPRGLNWYHHEEDPASRSRYILALFRRNPVSDGQKERINYEGYRIHWENGDPASLGLERFCQLGCRLLGLGRKMRDKNEQLVELGVHPVDSLESPITPVEKGTRCRRFYLERQSALGRLYFFNGSETEIVFDLERDDPRVLEWLGLPDVADGSRLWLDLSAQTV